MFYSLKYLLTGVLDFKFNQSLPGYLWKNCSLCEATARRLKWNLISVVVTFCQVPPDALCALLSCRPPLAGYSWQQMCKLWKPTPENQSIPTRAPTWTTFSLLSANGSSSDPFFVWIFHNWLSPCPIFMRSCKKNENKTVFYGKNESTNVAACWKTLLDGISSWQAMQMLWWEEIDCNSGKRGYKCGNSDAGIRLPGVNWSPLKEYLIHDGFKDAVNPHCWEAKWTLHVKILQWADLKMVIFTGSYKEQHRLAMIKWSEEIRNADYTFFCKAAIEK